MKIKTQVVVTVLEQHTEINQDGQEVQVIDRAELLYVSIEPENLLFVRPGTEVSIAPKKVGQIEQAKLDESQIRLIGKFEIL